jgi:hypothetical protein
LVELAKNPAYRKQITKVIGCSDQEIQSDEINLEYDKPNITLPKMDHILQKVVGANRMSMIDGFSMI